MKVVAHTGLVPVKALRGDARHHAGSVFGVLPAKAAAGVASGDFELVPIPDGIETAEVNVSVPTAAPAVQAKPPADLFDGDVEIPDDWKERHPLKRISIAQRLLNLKKLDPPDGMTATEYADHVIAKEIEVRAKTDTKPERDDGDPGNPQTQTDEPPPPSGEGGGENPAAE